jgi:glutamine amidotransferase PdxT
MSLTEILMRQPHQTVAARSEPAEIRALRAFVNRNCFGRQDLSTLRPAS